MTTGRWDIFCQVIDNFGDIGVCWRLAANLAAQGQQVRLWVDDASALQWMAPEGCDGVEVHPWTQPLALEGLAPCDVLVEAFGCTVAPEFKANCAQQISAGGQKQPKPVWINLEYLSAEDYVERCHRLPSRIMSGPAAGLTRWFFYPGFTSATGALVRELNLSQRQSRFAGERLQWRAAQGVQADECAVSLFCYEPTALPQFLEQTPTLNTRLLVTPGRATAAVQALPAAQSLNIQYLQPCPQPQFDEMLWACDLNLVRGEDSLVRAIWAGQPFVWHIYPQHDNAHHHKLNAFLDWLGAPESLVRFHRAWNGMTAPQTLPLLSREILAEWALCIRAGREKLALQTDLIEQLQAFVAEKS